jgi:thioredoxin 1
MEDVMGAALHTTDADFKKDVLDSKVPVLVDFWAEWCGPCRMVAPVLDELAKEYDGKIKIAKVNVDENQQVSMDFHIRSIPTLLFFKDGQMVKQLIGAHPKTKLVTEIQEMIGG